MGDLDFLQASSPVQIVGGDEQYAADVIQEFGQNKLVVKAEAEISSELKIVASDATQALPNATETTIISQGAGTVSGLVFRFSKNGVIVKLVIDSVIIFEINTDALRDLVDFNNAAQPNTYVSVNSNRRTFYFTPNFPIKANTSILLTVTPTENGTDLIGQVRQIS